MFKKTKRLICSLISVCMLTALPVTCVFAEDELNKSSNSTEDFLTGQNLAAPGKWSYLDGWGIEENGQLNRVFYLTQGDGNIYGSDKYTVDIKDVNGGHFVSKDGLANADTRPIIYNYTLDSYFADSPLGVNLKGMLGAAGEGKNRLQIVKTSDGKNNEIAGKVEVLYDETLMTHDFDFTIPTEKLGEGDDIMFIIRRTSSNLWWISFPADFTVKAMYQPQVATTVQAPEDIVIPYGGEVSITTETPGAQIYYTTDKSDPKTSETRKLYTGPFPLYEHATVRSYAEKEGMEDGYITDKHYKVDFPVRDFFGVANGPITAQEVDGFGLTRLDFAWPNVEPEQGKYDWEYIESVDRRMLEWRKEGYEPVMALAFTPVWAVKKDGYSFVHKTTGETYTYSPTVATEENGHKVYKGTQTITNRYGEVTTVRPYTASHIYEIDEKYVPEWENYIRFMVDRYSQPPYNVKYFQIWNEAYPSSGFYEGSLEHYMEFLHVPAAKVIREFEDRGVQIVFGGWSCGGLISEMENLLTEYDAWNLVDVFDLHYAPLAAMERIYQSAVKNGNPDAKVWQTEFGFCPDWYYPPNMYPRTLRWAMERGMWTKQDDFCNMVWFANWTPDDPAAYGYNLGIIRGDQFSDLGLLVKSFMELLYSNDLKPYNNFKTTPYMQPDIVEMHSSAEGFLMDGKKALIALHMVKQNSYTNLMTDTKGSGKSIDLCDPKTTVDVELNGVKGDVTATRIDVFGNRTGLSYERVDEDTIVVKVPTLDVDSKAKQANGMGSPMASVYLQVEAESITDANLTPVTY